MTAAPDGTLTDEAGASVWPDTFIWVFMTIREADANTVVQPQTLAPSPTRSGFTLWMFVSRRRLVVGRGTATQNLVTDRAGERNSDPRDTMEP